MIPSAVPSHNQKIAPPVKELRPLRIAAAAVHRMGIAAKRRNCGARRLAFSSTLTSHDCASS